MREIPSMFEFGRPWRMSEKSLGVVVPILRPVNVERSYVLSDEVQEKIDYEDSGDIDGVYVRNQHDEPVFFRGGNVLKGKGTQSRASRYGVVISPEKKKEVAVKCVHSSKPISSGKGFESKGYYPDRKIRSSLLEGNQSHVWSMVSQASGKALASAGESISGGESAERLRSTNNLAEVKEIRDEVSDFKSNVEEIIKNMPSRENQVGLIVLDEKGISGIEAFDHPDSWESLAESIVEEYEDRIRSEDETGLFDINEDRIESHVSGFFGNLGSLDREVVYEDEETKTILLEGDDIVGEVTTLNGETIHILFVREEDNKNKDRNRRLDMLQTEEGRGGPLGEVHTLGNEGGALGLVSDSFDTKGIGDTSKNHPYRRKGSKEVLEKLEDGPKTWSEIDLNVSTRTKSKRLKEAKESGYVSKVERESNGKDAYTLTPKGIHALRSRE